MKRFFLFSVFLLNSICAISQDTIFFQKHNFPRTVRNVLKSGNDIYVKTSDKLYKLQNGNWEAQKTSFTKPYVFYNQGFYEADYLPNEFDLSNTIAKMAHIIPQKSLSLPTIASIDDRLFLSAGGSLFEYKIFNYYKHFNEEISIRDIYFEKGLKVLSTYSGIFINDTIKAKKPNYSSGSFNKAMGKYFLCHDLLYKFTPPSTFDSIDIKDIVYTGLFRKVLEYKGKIYSQNIKSINILDSNFQPKSILFGYDFTDMEVADSLLVFCTQSGEIFWFDGKSTNLLCNTKSKIRDINYAKGKLYACTDAGVYTVSLKNPASLKLEIPLPIAVKSLFDVNNTLWVSTENGLYFLPDQTKVPIQLIENVEFNRGAMAYWEDKLYVGSTSGLYVIDVYIVMKQFLPAYLNKKKISEAGIEKTGIVLIIAGLVIFAGFVFYFQRKRKIKIHTEKAEEDIALNLDIIEKDIKTHEHLLSVETLAEYYKTNTVQLNRVFKEFDTTPGKFLRKVKLSLAKELLKKGTPIEKVVSRVGYSASYIKKELESDLIE